MVAGASSCTCDECGVVCRGRFNGCSAVWARGLVAVRTPLATEPDVIVGAASNGGGAEDLAAIDFSLAPALDVPLTPAEPAPRPKRVEPAPRVPLPRSPAPPSASAPVPPRGMPSAGIEGDGIALLRARIEGLRGEVKALGDSLGKREARTPSPATDSG